MSSTTTKLFRTLRNTDKTGGMVTLLPWHREWTDPDEGSRVPKEVWGAGGEGTFFLTGFEGVNPVLRPCLANPAVVCNGLFGDYDHVMTVDEALAQMVRSAKKPGLIRPTYVGASSSGKIKVFWEFPGPVHTGSHVLSEAFAREFASTAVMRDLLPGFDATCLEPNHLQHCGYGWVPVPDSGVVDGDKVFGALYSAAGKSVRKLRAEYREIPLDVVDAEVHRHWPSAPAITDGAMINLFWLPEDDPDKTRAAKVTLLGIACFSERAGTKFMSWRDLFREVNPGFVQAFEDSAAGDVMRSYYYDGRSYWHKVDCDVLYPWRGLNREQVKDRLNQAGLSSSAKSDRQLSEVAAALINIENVNRIAGAGPHHFHTEQVINLNGRRYLNTSSLSTRHADVEPDSTLVPTRDFPFLWRFIHDMWDAEVVNGMTPSQYLIWWLRRDLVAMREGRGLPPSHALVIAGPVGKGKTFFITRIFEPFYGRIAPASEYIRGTTDFNGDLIDAPLWILDDPEAAMDAKTRKTIADRIKNSLAQGYFRVNDKYEKAFVIQIRPRLVITCNDDEMSASVIPSSGDSMSDKVSYLLVRKDFHAGFSPDEESNNARAAAEFPRFLSWLLAQPAPEVDSRDGNSVRWGMRTYRHPALEEASHDRGYGMPDDAVLALATRAFLLSREGAPRDESGRIPFLFSELEAFMEEGCVPGLARSYTKDARRYAKAFKRMALEQAANRETQWLFITSTEKGKYGWPYAGLLEKIDPVRKPVGVSVSLSNDPF